MLKSSINLDDGQKMAKITGNAALEVGMKANACNRIGGENIMESVLKEHTMQLKQTKFAVERSNASLSQINAVSMTARGNFSVHDSINLNQQSSLSSKATPLAQNQFGQIGSHLKLKMHNSISN